MRIGAYAAALLAALTLAGCGGGGAAASGAPLDPEGPRFELRPDGTVPVGRFNAELIERDEDWESDPGQVAQIFVREQTQEGEQLGSTFLAPGDNATVRVTVSLENLADDSVDDLQVVVDLVKQDGTWLLTSATWLQRCKEGRGHQDFSADACV